MRYEISLSLSSKNILSANGPFPCGKYPDISIFKSGLKLHFLNYEMVLTDAGYMDERHLCNPADENEEIHRRALGRHETVNRIFKQFAELTVPFRYNLIMLSTYLMAIVNIVHAILASERAVFNARQKLQLIFRII